MYLGSDNYLGSTAYLGAGPNGTPEPIGDETVIEWRDITLHGLIGRFTIAELAGWDDLPDSRQQWDPRPNAHGTFDAPVYASERHVMVAGACFSKEQRDLLLRELKKAMTYGPHAEQLTVTHAGLRLSVAARLVRFNATYINWGEGTYGWQAEFVAPDPFRYGAKRMVYTGLPELKGGLNFPLFTDGTTSSTTTRAWTGTPGASTSTETVDGVLLRENLIPYTRDLTGWSATRATVAVATGVKRTPNSPDAWVMEATATDGGQYVIQDTAFRSALEASTPYVASSYVRPQFAHDLRMQVHEYDAAGVFVQAQSMPVAAVPAAVWTRLGYAFTTSATTAQVRLAAAQTAPADLMAVGEVIHVSEPMIEAGATIGAWFDGDTPDETAFGGGGWLDFGEAGSSGRITLRNDGDADAWPTHQVRGPAPEGFTITNVETGRRIVSTTVIPAGSTLTVHTAKGTAYLDGADRSGQLTVREWTSIPPGESYTFQFTAPTYTAASLVASIRDTYS